MTLDDALAALGPPHDVAREEYRRLVADDNPNVRQRDRYRELVFRLASASPRPARNPAPRRTLRLTPAAPFDTGHGSPPIRVVWPTADAGGPRPTPCCGGAGGIAGITP